MTSGYFFFLLLWTLHPIYLSTCKIEIDEERRWQATFRIFYDDLEDGIQNMAGHRPNLDARFLHQYEHSVTSYLEKHFEIGHAEDSLPLRMKSIVRVEEVIILTVSGETKWPEHEVTLQLDLLTEIFPQQKNIVQIHYSQTPVIYQSLNYADTNLLVPSIT